MKIKIDSANYIKEIQAVFKRSPLVYSQAQEIISNLIMYQEKAHTLLNEEKFFEAACIYKALMEKCVEHLSLVHDEEGILGKFLFQVFSEYSNSIQFIDIDKEHFYKETLSFYLIEDYGFALEIIKLIILNTNTKDEQEILEITLKLELKKEHSKYLQEKIAYLLLNLYHKINDNKKYLDTCQLFTADYWERYVFAAEKYEELGQLDKAIEIYEKGLNMANSYKDVLRQKLNELKQRILGLN